MAEHGKVIRLFLMEGVPSGRWKCELSNWTGLAYRVPRTMTPGCSDRPDLRSTGVYFLIGRTEDGTRDKVYVGEAESILPRISQHISNSREWQDWTEFVAFVSKDDALNKAMAKYLEASIYRMAKKAGRCELVNGNSPTMSSLSETDEAEMKEYLDNLRLLMGTMGHKFLEEEAASTRPGGKGETFHLANPRTEVSASAIMVDDGFLVLKGSKVSENINDSVHKGYKSLRAKLMEDGTIVDRTFTRDHLFDSCSAAMVVVAGRIDHPWGSWRTDDGRTLDEVYRKGPEEPRT
ncbi:MAG: GIY-YIG nuclease family protein [Candidatus Methanomethylophilaceae archaeon]|nr:GIY-YIG nuclease family protein [Candidatus Methanomethylophilaceae archaeon]